jgi:hypothetical protein
LHHTPNPARKETFMTFIQISERIGNFLQLVTALPFGVVGIALAIHVTALLARMA